MDLVQNGPTGVRRGGFTSSQTTKSDDLISRKRVQNASNVNIVGIRIESFCCQKRMYYFNPIEKETVRKEPREVGYQRRHYHPKGLRKRKQWSSSPPGLRVCPILSFDRPLKIELLFNQHQQVEWGAVGGAI
jgi:hypothetical protein